MERATRCGGSTVFGAEQGGRLGRDHNGSEVGR